MLCKILVCWKFLVAHIACTCHGRHQAHVKHKEDSGLKSQSTSVAKQFRCCYFHVLVLSGLTAGWGWYLLTPLLVSDRWGQVPLGDFLYWACISSEFELWMGDPGGRFSSCTSPIALIHSIPKDFPVLTFSFISRLAGKWGDPGTTTMLAKLWRNWSKLL